MHAVTFDVTVPRYLLAKSFGRLSDTFLYGFASGVSLRNVEEVALPGPRWVRLETVLAGICGSDIANLCYRNSPAMEPFGSFPAVLGHEIVARVIEVGAKVRDVEPGQRVVVDPVISCEVRGRHPTAWCRSCMAGVPGTCENAGEAGPLWIGNEPMARGLTIGYHRSLPGGWGERLLAHESQLYAIPAEFSDRRGVLMEPISIAVHALLRRSPRPDDTVLVIGSGPIALAAVWALRATGFPGDLVAQTKRTHEGELARALGASAVVTPGNVARDALVETGAQAYVPIIGPEVYAGGGFPVVYDCVGSKQSLDQALRFVSPRGRVVMLGNTGQLSRLDMTFLWARELDVKGFVFYGAECWRGREVHTFEVTRQLLAESGAPIERLVTHEFPLERYEDALSTAAHRGKTGSIKVLLNPKTLPQD